MNNEAIQRLRVPAAWALLGAVGAHVLGGLIYVFGAGGFQGSVASNFYYEGSAFFFSPALIAMILGAVFLVITAPQRSSANFPIVLIGLIFTGIAAFMALITLVMSFVWASEQGAMANGFSALFSIAGRIAVIAFAGLFLLKVFSDQTLVPRSAPPQMPPMGQPQSFAPQTGAQQSFAPQMGAQQSLAAQGYADPTQSAYQQPQQGYADPTQSAYQQPQQDWGTQQQGYADLAQQGYGQSWQQGQDAYLQQSGAQESYQAGYTQSGSQQPYGQDWQAGQPGYDSVGAQQSQAYGTGGQQAYGSAYDPAQYAPQGGVGGEQAYGQAYGTGGQQAYGSAYDPAQYAPQSGVGGEQAYGQAYGTGGQQAYGSAYDPAQYAPQSGTEGEQAAQDAAQYGWYQQPAADPEQPAQNQNAEQRQDAPLESFFASEEQQNAADLPQSPDPGYGGQYGTGSSYDSDQLGQPGADYADGQQNWYRDDDRR
ncbi:MAG: hypothetical protein M0026_16010 [Nocardiopsaceae bacterium]|nr:hypothetical protein [Nocardiopsaceae bacterium]